jgi:hypothetical protein
MKAVPTHPTRVPRGRLLGHLLRLFFVLAVTFAWSSDAQAYAWMIRHGYAKCNACHTDPSGGETLTHMGRVESQLLLSHPWGGAPKLNDQAKLLYGLDEPDSVRIGGSLRYMNLYAFESDAGPAEFSSFPMQADLYGWADLGAIQLGGSVGAGNVMVGTPHMRAAQVTSGEGLVLLSRNHWLGVELGEDAMLRAGRLNLPFGVRIPEHVTWVREITRTDRESDQQHGLALSYWGGAWRAEGMLVLGNYQIAPDDFRERGYAGFAEYLLSSRLAVGVSSMILQSRSGPHFNPVGAKVLRHAHGVTARYSPMTELAILSEVDVLKNTGSKFGFTALLQGDYEFTQGLHGILTVEALDQGKADVDGAEDALGAGKPIVGIWGGVNWFFLPHLDLRLEAVYRKGSATSVQSQLHFFF